MKKLVLALCVMLLLAGCAEPMPAESTAAPTESVSTEPTETEPAGLYQSESPLERATGGAVRTYELGNGTVTALSMLGQRLLICADDQVLILTEGTQAAVVRTRDAEAGKPWSDLELQRLENGLVGYAPAPGEMLTLDAELRSGAGYELPGALPLHIAVRTDPASVYYAVGEGIRVLDLQQGTSRLLRQEPGKIRRLDGLRFDGALLQYTRLREDGMAEACFIDPDTGSLRRTALLEDELITAGDRFFVYLTVRTPVSEDRRMITGTRTGGPEAVFGWIYGWDNPIVLPGGQILLQKQGETGLELACFDLADGTELGRILLPEQESPVVTACVDGGALWFSDGQSGCFFRWEMAPAADGERLSWLVPYSSLSNPSEENRQAVDARRMALEDAFDLHVSYAQADNRTEGVDYSRMPDHVPMQYACAGDLLGQTLEQLPEGFLDSVRRKAGGTLLVELTDRYDPAWPAKPGTGSMDLTGGKTRIRVDMSGELPAIFYHELWHVLEVQLHNRSDRISRWNRLNPSGFDYSGSVETDPETYLGVTADGWGMVSAREDRAQLFACACLPDQQERLAKPVLQEKLRFLCELLRENYDCGDQPIWEQYLERE